MRIKRRFCDLEILGNRGENDELPSADTVEEKGEEGIFEISEAAYGDANQTVPLTILLQTRSAPSPVSFPSVAVS